MDDQVTREQDLDLESDKVALINSTQICLIFECFKTTVEIGKYPKIKFRYIRNSKSLNLFPP